LLLEEEKLKLMDNNILKELSIKYNLPIQVIEKIVRSPFKFTVDIMKEGNFKPIRHPYLGVFAVKPGRLDKLNNK